MTKHTWFGCATLLIWITYGYVGGYTFAIQWKYHWAIPLVGIVLAIIWSEWFTRHFQEKR